MKLYRFSPFPPGEFPYSQVWKGVTYSFPSEGLDIQTQAARILKFRRANGLPKATIDETLDDLNVFTCQRLGNDPKWCGENGKAAQSQHVQTGSCDGCGAKI